MLLLSLPLALLLSDATAEEAAPAVTPHLFVHLRPELRTNPGFQADLDDTVLAVQQAMRVGASGVAGRFSGRVDVQEFRVWGARSGSTGAEPAVHAYQGYIEADTGSGYVRVGRQELHLHQGYFLSRAPFNPGGRSFDAARWHLDLDRLDADVFASQLVAPGGFADGETPFDVGDWFGGGQATLRASDVFVPSVRARGRRRHPGRAQPPDLIGRLGRGLPTDPPDVDGMAQIGEDTGVQRRAWQVIARAEQGFDATGRPGVAARFEQSSGSACAGEPDGGDCTSAVDRTMDLQFGRNFYLRGLANQVAATNSRQMALEAFAQPADGLRVELIGSWFQLTDPEGPWCNGGVLQGAGWRPATPIPTSAGGGRLAPNPRSASPSGAADLLPPVGGRRPPATTATTPG